MNRIDLSSASMSESSCSTPSAHPATPECIAATKWSPLSLGGTFASGTFAAGLTCDTADTIVEFIGPNVDALRLSLANRNWAMLVRTADMWRPILASVAPFSTLAIRRRVDEARDSGTYSARMDWVTHLAVAWRVQLALQSPDSVKALRIEQSASAGPLTSGLWWLARALPFRSSRPRRCVVTGCISSGKRTYVERLKAAYGGKMQAGMAFSSWTAAGWEFVVMNVVGVRRIVPLLRTFFTGADGLVVVLDATSPAALAELRDELVSWILPDGPGVPVTFIVNKLDVAGAASCEKTLEMLGLQRAGVTLFHAQHHIDGSAVRSPITPSARRVPDHGVPQVYRAPPPATEETDLDVALLSGGRRVAAVGTCLAHAVVGRAAAQASIEWLTAAADARVAGKAS